MATKPPNNVPRLEWDTKPRAVERVALPFQVVETINESRATREAQVGTLLAGTSSPTIAAWRNKLIWGDNKVVSSSLLEEYAGRVNLVYIDPPFDTGADFSVRVTLGDADLVKEPSILEEHAYRDTWGSGYGSYLSMMYARLCLIYELLHSNGALYVHVSPGVSHGIKLICDEIFGREHFRNEVIWKRTSAHSRLRRYGPVHDVILYYAKGDDPTWNPQHTTYDEEYIETFYYRVEEGTGRRYRLSDLTSARPGGRYLWRDKPPPGSRYWGYAQERMEEFERTGRLVYSKNGIPSYKRYLDEMPGPLIQDVWSDVSPIASQSGERVGYETQKPLPLLKRILTASSVEGDLVADLFCGSGTTLVAAEEMGRRWIGCDLGRFAIHTTRKRLLSLPDCTPFEILNLGRYERQYWQQATTGGEIDAYLGFILALYDAQLMKGYQHLHGKKADRLVHVGAVDAPVTIDEIEHVMDEVAAYDFKSVDVLGWEWEMGLHDVVAEEARRRGLDMACRQIPREVMKAEAGDETRFFELAYLELQVDRNGHSVRVQVRDFVIPSDELIPEAVREQVTQWSDYIDYWSVDFNFRDDTFHNEWQAYRTREEPKLAVDSDWHDYELPGRYLIVVKVIDIFGNDTTKLAEVVVK